MSRFPLGIVGVALWCLSQSALVMAAVEHPQIRGRVLFHGSLPPGITQVVKADEHVCGKEVQVQPVEVYGVTLGLRSAVVSVMNAPSFDGDAEDDTWVMANDHCVFTPRVGAARLGNILEIQNRDPILHNTHIKKGKRTFLNVAQLAGSRPILKKLKRTGVHVFRCDKHTFMTGALLVFAHPYFALTDKFGGFELPPLPAGTYTLAVWHETLGRLEKDVTVPAQGSVTVNFDYL